MEKHWFSMNTGKRLKHYTRSKPEYYNRHQLHGLHPLRQTQLYATFDHIFRSYSDIPVEFRWDNADNFLNIDVLPSQYKWDIPTSLSQKSLCNHLIKSMQLRVKITCLRETFPLGVRDVWMVAKHSTRKVQTYAYSDFKRLDI
jgi:hypothetical protein